MKALIFTISIFLLLSCSKKQEKYFNYPISEVDIKNVVLTDSFWLPKIQTIQEVTIPYSFDKCDKEGRMDNFLIAGGKKEGKTQGKMPFDDTDLYKIIEGASYSLISHPNPKLDAYLDSIIEIIKAGQEPDGYLTTWFTIDRKNPPAWWVKPSEKRWENEISSHELYNSGHLFEAAAAHYRATGKRNLLDIAIKNADLLVQNFGPGKLYTPPGHQVVETGLIKLYQITKNVQYLELAKFYLDQRGDSTNHNLFGAYSQDYISVVMQDEVVGHAVRAVYMYAGMTDIAAIYRDADYLNAVNNLWKNMVNKKMYITGGIGARHEGESFGDNYELPNISAYSETCAAIGSVYWNHRLFLLTGKSKYYDVIERTLYNALIAGISVDGINFFYPNPLESDGKYTFNMGSCTRQHWFDCSCCPTNLIRFIPSVPGLVYAVNKDSLYINLYMSNNAKIMVENTSVNVNQETNYPWQGNIKINISPEKKKIFTIKLRIPGWAQNIAVPGDLYYYLNNDEYKIEVKVNGEEYFKSIQDGYIEITKKWNIKDEIEITFPFYVKQVIANEKVEEVANQVAIEYGPFVYCAEEIDNFEKLSQVIIPDKIQYAIEKKTIISNPVNYVKCMVYTRASDTEMKETQLNLIPYYLWSNRGVGEMSVWFKRD